MEINKPNIYQRLSAWIRSLDPYDPNLLERDGLTPIRLEEDSIKKKTARVIVVMFLLFGVWAVWAPLDEGVVVPGTVVVKGNRKAVQHPGGGVVQEILVKEGDHVKEGTPLIILNSLGIQAELNTAELEFINSHAVLSRLISERFNRNSIEWSPKLELFRGDPRLEQAKRLQLEMFKSRKAELDGQQSILKEQIIGLEAQLRGLTEAITERRSQLKLIKEEAENIAELAASGYVPRTQATQIERSRSEMIAGLATASSEQSRVQASIAAARMQLVQMYATYHRDLDSQISEYQKQQQSLESKVESLRFNHNLTTLRAPADGTVVGLKAHTTGGVIAGGAVLMEIVPLDGKLVVDAQVPPIHIDKMRQGMDVSLRFTAFSMATTPVVSGKVVLVGADKQTTTSTSATAISGQGTDFYLVQVEATDDELKALGQTIQPGMPVDAIFKTGERNFVSLLVKPITDRFARAFKE